MNKKINAIEFQKKFKQKLNQKIKEKIKSLTEEVSETDTDEMFIDDEKTDEYDEESPETDEDSPEPEEIDPEDEDLGLDRTSEENKVVIEIQKKASEAGVDISGYMHGVLQLDFDAKDEVDKFMDFIEDYDKIEAFELKSCDEDGNESEENDDCAFYRFWVYLKPELVSYDYFDEIHGEDESDETEEESEEDEEESDETEEESEDTLDDETVEDSEEEEESDEDEDKKVVESYITEMKRLIKVNYRGAKRVKMKCAPGYKYNRKFHVCEKISGSLLSSMRKGVKKTLIKKSQGGLSLKRRTAFKTRRANKFRTSFGL